MVAIRHTKQTYCDRIPNTNNQRPLTITFSPLEITSWHRYKEDSMIFDKNTDYAFINVISRRVRVTIVAVENQ
jgi:hypothetical protein